MTDKEGDSAGGENNKTVLEEWPQDLNQGMDSGNSTGFLEDDGDERIILDNEELNDLNVEHIEDAPIEPQLTAEHGSMSEAGAAKHNHEKPLTGDNGTIHSSAKERYHVHSSYAATAMTNLDRIKEVNRKNYDLIEKLLGNLGHTVVFYANTIKDNIKKYAQQSKENDKLQDMIKENSTGLADDNKRLIQENNALESDLEKIANRTEVDLKKARDDYNSAKAAVMAGIKQVDQGVRQIKTEVGKAYKPLK